jgi:hypothetical protein
MSDDVRERPDATTRKVLIERRAWPDDMALVRAFLRTKAALDRVEDEAGTRVPSRLALVFDTKADGAS